MMSLDEFYEQETKETDLQSWPTLAVKKVIKTIEITKALGTRL
jgi:hypothetical protein